MDNQLANCRQPVENCLFVQIPLDKNSWAGYFGEAPNVFLTTQ